MLKPFLFIYCVFIIFTLTYTKDYCKICKNKSHTMCKYKGRAQSCINYESVKMTPKIRAKIENLHNEHRNRVASGQETRGTPGPQPSATNMLVLKWDNELSKIAQRWADQCRSPTEANQHDECKLTKRFEVGQNVIQGIRGQKTLEFEDIVTKMIQRWYDEVGRIGLDQIKKFQGANDPEDEVGHYAQLIWAKTKYIGCAHASFAENMTRGDTITQERVDTFVCNYGPTGNIVGASIYTIGKSCSECTKCVQKYPALCEDSESFTETETEAKTKRETKREAKDDSNLETKTESQYPKKKTDGKTKVSMSSATKQSATSEQLITSETTLEANNTESPHHHHHHLKGEKCPFESLRTRFRVLHRDGDECYCLFRTRDSAKKFLPETYLLYLFLLILYYF